MKRWITAIGLVLLVAGIAYAARCTTGQGLWNTYYLDAVACNGSESAFDAAGVAKTNAYNAWVAAKAVRDAKQSDYNSAWSAYYYHYETLGCVYGCTEYQADDDCLTGSELWGTRYTCQLALNTANADLDEAEDEYQDAVQDYIDAGTQWASDNTTANSSLSYYNSHADPNCEDCPYQTPLHNGPD